MDKLKIVKMLVFLLTFLVFFTLCLLVNKAFISKNAKPFEMMLETKGAKIDGFDINGDYGYILAGNTIYVVDVKKSVYKGSIFTKGEQ